jgi:hypothetical protein
MATNSFERLQNKAFLILNTKQIHCTFLGSLLWILVSSLRVARETASVEVVIASCVESIYSTTCHKVNRWCWCDLNKPTCKQGCRALVWQLSALVVKANFQSARWSQNTKPVEIYSIKQ